MPISDPATSWAGGPYRLAISYDGRLPDEPFRLRTSLPPLQRRIISGAGWIRVLSWGTFDESLLPYHFDVVSTSYGVRQRLLYR